MCVLCQERQSGKPVTNPSKPAVTTTATERHNDDCAYAYATTVLQWRCTCSNPVAVAASAIRQKNSTRALSERTALANSRFVTRLGTSHRPTGPCISWAHARWNRAWSVINQPKYTCTYLYIYISNVRAARTLCNNHAPVSGPSGNRHDSFAQSAGTNLRKRACIPQNTTA